MDIHDPFKVRRPMPASTNIELTGVYNILLYKFVHHLLNVSINYSKIWHTAVCLEGEL